MAASKHKQAILTALECVDDYDKDQTSDQRCRNFVAYLTGSLKASCDSELSSRIRSLLAAPAADAASKAAAPSSLQLQVN